MPQVPHALSAAADADPKDLAKAGRAIVDMLLAELRAVSAHAGLIEEIIEEETRGDRSPKRRQMLLRIVSLPTRTQAARNLASAMSILTDIGPGKKAQAAEEAAAAAAEDDDWGSDLNPSARQQARVN